MQISSPAIPSSLAVDEYVKLASEMSNYITWNATDFVPWQMWLMFDLAEREIDRTLSCRDDLWNENHKAQTRWFRKSERTSYDLDQPENLGAFSYYIELLGFCQGFIC